MTEVVSSAKSARESLARGLGALQSPGVPEHLMGVAEPIARAMSSLHRIESTQGQALVEAAPVALDAVRSALSMLQSAPIAHPAVDAAMEAVAGSLGLVHFLTKAMSAPAPAAAPQVQAMAATAVIQPNPAVGLGAPIAGYGAPAAAPPAAGYGAPAAAPAPLYPPMGSPQPAPAGQMAGGVANAPPAVAQAPGYVQNPTMASEGNRGFPQPAAVQSATPAAQVLGNTQPESALAADNGLPRMDASLGAHSPTNFYKGLSGNDVVDAGGIFVATYQIPRMGSPLLLRVSLPGGYEFEAQAVVRWTREPASVADGSSPGFGAQFTHISPEGRQLVYRYVRNREPLFHDDL